jgi:hypothetical protein
MGLAGRDLDCTDGPSVVVTDILAQKLYPDPIGRTLRFGGVCACLERTNPWPSSFAVQVRDRAHILDEAGHETRQRQRKRETDANTTKTTNAIANGVQTPRRRSRPHRAPTCALSADAPQSTLSAPAISICNARKVDTIGSGRAIRIRSL